jgi:hypothetical protein
MSAAERIEAELRDDVSQLHPLDRRKLAQLVREAHDRMQEAADICDNAPGGVGRSTRLYQHVSGYVVPLEDLAIIIEAEAER